MSLGVGRTTSNIARFLNVSRQTVRTQLLRHGLAEPQANPFRRYDDDPDIQEMQAGVMDNADDTELPVVDAPEVEHDGLLDPIAEIPDHLPNAIQQHEVTSYTGLLSGITDDELDNLIVLLRTHFRNAGVTTLHGMLRSLGHRVPRTRINQSLSRIDPVQRIFQRIRIRRRTYQVAGPNALWHHDGQHGMSMISEKRRACSLNVHCRAYSLGNCNTRIY